MLARLLSLTCVALLLTCAVARAQQPDGLPQGAASRIGTAWFAGSAELRSLALSADGKLLAIGDQAGNATIYHTATGTRFQTLALGIGPVKRLAFSPTAPLLAAAGSTNDIVFWDFGQAKPATHKAEIPKGRNGLFAANVICFSPDGASVAIATDYNELLAWESATGKLIAVMRGPEMGSQQVVGAAFTPDGKSLVAVNAAGVLGQTDLKKGSGKWTLQLPDSRFASNRPDYDCGLLAIAPDGKRVYFATLSSGIRATNIPKGNQAWNGVQSLSRNVTAPVTLLHDGRLLVTLKDGQTVHLVETENGKHLEPPDGQVVQAKRIAVASNANTVATWTAATGVRLWSVDKSGAFKELSQWQAPIASFAFVGNDKLVIARGGEHLELVDRATGKAITKIATGLGDATLVTAVPGKEMVLAAGRTSGLAVVPLPKDGKATIEPTLLPLADVTRGPAVTLGLSPDGKWLAVTGKDLSISLWDMATLEPRQWWRSPITGSGLTFSPGGKSLAVLGKMAGTVELRDPATGERQATFSVSYAQSLAFVANRPDLLVATDLGLDVLTPPEKDKKGLVKARIDNRRDGIILKCAVLGDDARLMAGTTHNAVAGGGRKLLLWDATTGKELHSYDLGSFLPQALAFSPDGHWLAAASHDGTIVLWPTDIKKAK